MSKLVCLLSCYNCQQVDKWSLCCVVVSVVEASEKTQNSCKLHPQTWWRGKFMRLKNKSALCGKECTRQKHCQCVWKLCQGRNVTDTHTMCTQGETGTPCGLITVTDSETLSFKSPVISHWSKMIEL